MLVIPASAQVSIDQYMELACSNAPKVCESGKKIARRAASCIKLPEPVPSEYQFLARILLENGEVKFISVAPGAATFTAWQKEAVAAIADGVTKCEPYIDVPVRAVIEFTPALVQSDWR